MAEAERQIAWKLSLEMTDRKALIGDKENAVPFDGELLSRSLDSVHAFFQRTREIMQEFPATALSATPDGQPVALQVFFATRRVLRPFLERWHAAYQYWWEHKAGTNLPPMELQLKFPQLGAFLDDWTAVRLQMRELRLQLIRHYEFPDDLTAQNS